MSTRKSGYFYGVLFGLICLVAGMVLASRLDLTPASLAGPINVPATNSTPISGPIDATTFRNIAHDVSPAVVSILTTSKRPRQQTMSDLFGLDPFGGQGGGANRRGRVVPPQEEQVRGAGSGFVVDKAGYILTNNHVVEDATSIFVKFAGEDEREDGYAAKVVGRDPLTDSALIQLTDMPKEPLTEIKFGDSSQIAAGDWVVAIGNPFRFSNTVTVGVVSAVGRVNSEMSPVPGRDLEFIQTDAAINPGNSGGPLLNIRGEVVGINTAIISSGMERANIGLGFAVPINTIHDILPKLRTGSVVRGKLGVGLSRALLTNEDARDLYGLPNNNAAVVADVPAGPAKDAGIKPGDVIVEFNGKNVKNNSELVNMVTALAPGTTVPVRIIREKKPMTLNVKLGQVDVEAEQQLSTGGLQRPEMRQPEAPADTGVGMHVEGLTPDVARQAHLPAGRSGVVVTDVDSFGSAIEGGLRPGDIILAVNGQPVSTVDQVTQAFARVAPRRAAGVLVWRADRQAGTGAEQYLQIRKH
jgi:serine protease Do